MIGNGIIWLAGKVGENGNARELFITTITGEYAEESCNLKLMFRIG